MKIYYRWLTICLVYTFLNDSCDRKTENKSTHSQEDHPKRQKKEEKNCFRSENSNPNFIYFLLIIEKERKTETMEKFIDNLSPMDLMRSEKMSLVQLIIPVESAHRAVSYLGELGLLQFRDVCSLFFFLYLDPFLFCAHFAFVSKHFFHYSCKGFRILIRLFLFVWH